jgi:enterobactin synthetase component F
LGIIWRHCVRSSRTGRIICWVIPWAARWRRVAARLREQGETVAFLGLLDTLPPETQTGRRKEANGLDPAVLAEIERERQAFIAAQQGQGSSELFNAIEGNYADAVRLLTTAQFTL